MVCSLATGRHRRLMEMAAPTLDAYAARHGWDMVLSSEDLAPDRPPSWSKIVLIEQLLDRYEFVFWVDADALVVDTRRCVLDEVDLTKRAWFAEHPQDGNEHATVLNAGVVLLRSGEVARDLLRSMWNETQYIDHNWWENAALLDLLGYSLEPPYERLRGSRFDDDIGELDLDWNSVPGHCVGDQPALHHHARADHDSFERRLASMSADLENARRTFPRPSRLAQLGQLARRRSRR